MLLLDGLEVRVHDVRDELVRGEDSTGEDEDLESASVVASSEEEDSNCSDGEEPPSSRSPSPDSDSNVPHSRRLPRPTVLPPLPESIRSPFSPSSALNLASCSAGPLRTPLSVKLATPQPVTQPKRFLSPSPPSKAHAVSKENFSPSASGSNPHMEAELRAAERLLSRTLVSAAGESQGVNSPVTDFAGKELCELLQN
jgi:hypothetical protein